jgi:hypothetical protein
MGLGYMNESEVLGGAGFAPDSYSYYVDDAYYNRTQMGNIHHPHKRPHASNRHQSALRREYEHMGNGQHKPSVREMMQPGKRDRPSRQPKPFYSKYGYLRNQDNRADDLLNETYEEYVSKQKKESSGDIREQIRAELRAEMAAQQPNNNLPAGITINTANIPPQGYTGGGMQEPVRSEPFCVGKLFDSGKSSESNKMLFLVFVFVVVICLAMCMMNVRKANKTLEDLMKLMVENGNLDVSVPPPSAPLIGAADV